MFLTGICYLQVEDRGRKRGWVPEKGTAMGRAAKGGEGRDTSPCGVAVEGRAEGGKACRCLENRNLSNRNAMKRIKKVERRLWGEREKDMSGYEGNAQRSPTPRRGVLCLSERN